MKRGGWWELAAICLAVLVFCQGFLDLGAATRLPGNESEVFQVLDWVQFHSLRQDGTFPLWNPYLRTGLPYIADPMLHLFNPLVSLPVLALGVSAGFKLAVFLSFLAAALGMRQLGLELGLSPVVRLWAVGLYTFAGQPVARFFQGQYLFIFGFAWLPWIFWGLLKLARREAQAPGVGRSLWVRHAGRVYGALTALALALLFFSGNAYYAFYMLLLAPLFVLTQALQFQPRFPYVRVDWQFAARFGGVGLLALGLAAVQLIPAVQFWPWIGKPTDVVGSHTPLQIFLDYISRDTFRPDAYQALPAREEYYAYIGLWPFLGLALFPLGWLKFAGAQPDPAAGAIERRRLWGFIAFLLLVCLLVVLWVDLDQAPWRQFFIDTRFLVQFRALLRILIFGSLALILLAALCLQQAWALLAAAPARWAKWSRAGQAALLLFLALGVGDVFFTNRAYVHSQPLEPEAYDIAAWLRGQDTADDFVRVNPNNTWHDALVSYRLRSVEGWYHFGDIHPAKTDASIRAIEARPVYLAQPPQDGTAYYPDADLLGQVSGLDVYRLTQSLPLAFSVTQPVLYAGQAAGPLTRQMVTAQNWVAPDVNTLETIASGAAGDTLVVLYTSYPGWELHIDGQPANLLEKDHFLAAQMLPGAHKYTFIFRPLAFSAGLLVSLAAAALLGFFLWSGAVFDRQAFKARFRAWLADLRSWRLPRLRDAAPGSPPQRLETGAVYRDGALTPDQPLDFAEGQRLHVTVDALPENGLAAWQRWLWSSGSLLRSLARRATLESALLAGALAIYLLVRLVGLTDWPIYFFTDEAVQTVMAADFVHQGFQNYDKEVMPTYFSNGPSFNLSSVTVYVQVLPYLLFGKSAYVTRAVSMLISALGALFVALILKRSFKLRHAWIGVLLLSTFPAWFLHSRTAFEPVEMSAFYAGFLYFYLRYRDDQPLYLFPAIFFGALVFYTYSPGQLVMAVSGGLLFLSDLRYHLKQWRWLGWGSLFLLAMALPYVRYLLAHPGALQEHLSQRAPYWLEQIPFVEKLGHYFQEYARAFSPYYWFWPNDFDLVRHLMKGYGHITVLALPFVVLGLGLALSRLRQPAYRAVLLALLAAPTGSALVQINITRALVMLIPLALLAALGLGWCLERLGQAASRLTPRFAGRLAGQNLLAGAVFLVFAGANVYMLNDALTNGPLWYQNYTLDGMQYGAQQLFGVARQYAQAHPDSKLIISPVWTNGTDVVKRFFVPDELNVDLGSVTGYMFQRLPLDDKTVFVVVPEEFQQVINSGKFKTVNVEQTLSYPNGQPGFYFIRLAYVDNIDQILEAEHQQRLKLQEVILPINGEWTQVGYNMLDMGPIDNVFDGNEATLARTLEANPFVIQLDFTKPRALSGLKFYIGGTNAQIKVTLFSAGLPPAEFTLEKQGSVADPRAELDFGQTYTVQRLRLEYKDLSQGEPGHVHLWEIGFK